MTPIHSEKNSRGLWSALNGNDFSVPSLKLEMTKRWNSLKDLRVWTFFIGILMFLAFFLWFFLLDNLSRGFPVVRDWVCAVLLISDLLLVYTTQVNSAFDARWLAISEVISEVLFTSEHRAAHQTLKIDHFSANCYRYSSFWRCLFKLVWYMLKQLFTSVSMNGGGYLPRLFAARQISTTIHLYLRE